MFWAVWHLQELLPKEEQQTDSKVHDNLHIEICCSREAVKRWMVKLVIEVIKKKWDWDWHGGRVNTFGWAPTFGRLWKSKWKSFMPPKRKERPLPTALSFIGSRKSPDEKRSRAECDKIFEALDMAENLGVKIEAILKKLEKLDIIELQLNEVHAKVANIEETVGRLDSEVQDLKIRPQLFKRWIALWTR